MQRVKVYHITEDDLTWEDKGTGYLRMDYLEQSEELGIYVADEDDKETLLIHRISSQNIYEKENDTIITWRDPEGTTRTALSFVEAVGCTNIWNHICSTQRIRQFSSLHGETSHSVNSELKFPVVNLDNLPQILEIVTESNQMEVTKLILKDHEFFQKLIHVFEGCEETNNVDGLHTIFHIVKSIISLNSSQILEIILGDQLIMKIIGCLEYDPDNPQSQHHRNYLRDHVAFKEPIPINDPLVLSKIHQAYRIGYLKDVVLTKDPDDDGTWEDTSEKLESVIKANITTIATLLRNDSNFIQELFARLRSPTTTVESRNNLAHFLLEFCSLSKSLEMQQKLLFIGELTSKGIFDVIAEVLQCPDKKLVLTGTNILCTLFKNDETLLYSDAVRPGSPLFGHLVKGLMEDFGDKMHCQFVEILRNVLESLGDKRRVIMGRFCERHIFELVDFIAASCPERPGNTSEGASTRVGSHRGAQPEVLLAICDLLCICVVEDASRRSFFHQNLTEKVMRLTRRKEKYLVAAAVRFLRTLLSIHDDDVQSDIVENNVLEPIIDVFVANGHRDNLLTSAILELLEHISKGKIPVLLKYVVDTFWDQLAPFEHLRTIQSFKKKYDQCFENRGKGLALVEDKSASASASASASKPHGSASSASPSKRYRGLVDYDDDEDDNEDSAEDPSKKPRVSPTSEGNKNSP